MVPLKRILAVAAPLVLFSAGVAREAAAQYAQPAPAPGPGGSGAYYSWRMQASFVIQPIDLTPYGGAGYRPVAQLVTTPSPYSPLGRIGLTPGDMITRLDDIPIATYADLDSHYTLTKVTYIKQGYYYAQQAWVDLGPLYPGGGSSVDPAPGSVTPVVYYYVVPARPAWRWGYR